MKKQLFAAVATLLLVFFFASCKQEGCTDPASVNFDAEADEDDGSCLYPSDLYHGSYVWLDTTVTTQTSSGVQTTDYYTGIGNITKGDKTLVFIDNFLRACLPGKAAVTATEMMLLSTETCGINGTFSFDGTKIVFEYDVDQFFYTEHHRGVAIKQP